RRRTRPLVLLSPARTVEPGAAADPPAEPCPGLPRPAEPRRTRPGPVVADCSSPAAPRPPRPRGRPRGAGMRWDRGMETPPRCGPPRRAPLAQGLTMLREVIAQTCALVAPRQCPCGREGARLCPACAALLHAEPRRVESCCDALQMLTSARVREERREGEVLPAGVDHTPLLPVLALGEYGGDLQRLVLAWKNGGM